MTGVAPISLEILACFILSVTLLNRYSDMVNTNIITVVGVFISWFFSFTIIFLLPADLTSTAYRQCVADFQASQNMSTISILNNNISIETTLNHTQATIPQHSVFTHALSSPTYADISDQPIPANNNTNITNPCVTPWSYLPDTTLTKLWRFIYWTSQMLTWLILPIMQSYSMAGNFNTIDRLKFAIRANLIYYSSYAAIFLVLLIYVIFRNGFEFPNLKVIAITSSNTWGLFLLVVLLGYGLVELPRFLINRSKYSQSLSQLYFKVAQVNSEKCEAEEKLDDVLEEIHQAFTVLGNAEHSPMKRYLTLIVDKCPADWKRRSNAFRRQAAASNSAYDNDTSKIQAHSIESLTRLHRKVIVAVHHHRQITCRWNHLIKEVIEWEDVARNQSENQESRMFRSTLPKERSIINSFYTPRVEWYWKCIVSTWILWIIGLVMATLSLAVVWSEIAFPISIFSPKLSVFAFFVDQFQVAQQYFYLEMFSIISIGYLAICAFYTVFHMKIYNVYYLASNGQTDEYSLLFSGMLLCRLTAPLCLNYLCLVHRDSHVIKQNSIIETSFTTIMGHLDLIPIVNNGLNIFLPLCISAICSAIYFNIGTHILHSLGFDQFIEDDEMTIDWVQTGRELVVREKTKLLRNIGSSTALYHEMVSANTEPVNVETRKSQVKSAQISNSPTSSSSSSSGFSRSSLLPKSDRLDHRENLNQPTIQQQVFPASIRLEDNVVAIDMESKNKSNLNSPGGFFDDV